MATHKQIDANRRNAQKSSWAPSGHRTPEGKAASRFNALKHGIHAQSQCIPGENPEDLEALAHDYYLEYQPLGPTQRHFVDRLILCDWLRRRYHRIQSEILHQLAFEIDLHSEFDESVVLAGQAVLESTRHSGDPVVKIFRQINANDRTYDRALASLLRLQAQSASSISAERTQFAQTETSPPDTLPDCLPPQPPTPAPAAPPRPEPEMTPELQPVPVRASQAGSAPRTDNAKKVSTSLPPKPGARANIAEAGALVRSEAPPGPGTRAGAWTHCK